jgi:hypothetical protein
VIYGAPTVIYGAGIPFVGDFGYYGPDWTPGVGWIRSVERTTYCEDQGWAPPDCDTVTETEQCIPGVGCFVRSVIQY